MPNETESISNPNVQEALYIASKHLRARGKGFYLNSLRLRDKGRTDDANSAMALATAHRCAARLIDEMRQPNA